MSDELRELRAAVYNLSNADWIKRTDEEWYDELWKLLEPVVDARAERAFQDVEQRAKRATLWASWTSKNPPAHVDLSKLDDPDNG